MDVQQLAESLLPMPHDDVALRKHFVIHVSRIDNIEFLKLTFDGVVEWHIKHQFYEHFVKQVRCGE